MKRNDLFPNGLILGLVSLFIMILTFSAPTKAAQATLQFTSIPTVQSMGTGSTQSLTYTVKNNVLTSPVSINYIVLSPASSNDTLTSWTTSCNKLVPAGGTCNITLVLTANTEGTVNQNLQIYYGDRNTLLQTPISFRIGSGITFTQQASNPGDIPARTTKVLYYSVQNQSKINSISLTSMSFLPNSASDVTIARNNCSNTIAPGGSCSITVRIMTTNQTGSVTQALNILYTDGFVSNTLVSNPVTFNVTANPSALAFVEPTPTAADMNPNQVAPQVLSYTVQNLGAQPVVITSAAVTSSSLDSTTTTIDCTGGIVTGNNGTCGITVTITAGASSGAVSQTLNINYTNALQPLSTDINFNITASVLPSLRFVIQPLVQNLNNTGPSGGNGVNSSETVRYVVQNRSTSAATVSATTVTNAPGTLTALTNTATIAPITGLQVSNPWATCTTSCSPTNIPANCGCFVNLQIQSQGTNGTVNQTLSITSNATPSPLLSNPMIFAVTDQNQRSYTFVNQCSYPVWIGVSGGSQESCTTKVPNTQGTCFSTNETCVLTDAATNTSTCFWNNPTPIDAGGSYQLAAASTVGEIGGVGTVSIPIPVDSNNPQNLIWSGGIAGRTGCGGGVGTLCSTGDCSGNAPGTTTGTADPGGACTITKGFTNPVAVDETSMANGLTNSSGSLANTDFYDVTIIGGVNLPLSITPMNPQPRDTTGYSCGAPGSPTGNPDNDIAGCTWTLTPPNSDLLDYAMVPAPTSSSFTTCTSNADCTSPDICGFAANPFANGFAHICGPHVGYWTADTVCAVNANSTSSTTWPAAYNCNAVLSPGTINTPWLTYYRSTDLYACDAITSSAQTGGTPDGNGNPTALKIPSCYDSSAVPNSCCGCQNWNQAPYNLNVGSDPQLCTTSIAGTATTQAWTTGTNSPLQQIGWLKQGCSTAYTFPFDDPTSTFTCSTTPADAPTANRENYIVTYCPNGLSGGITG